MSVRPPLGLVTLTALLILIFCSGCTQTATGNTSLPGFPAITPEQTAYAPAVTVSQAFVVAATVSRSTDRTIEITYQGGQDAGYLQYISVTVNGIAEGGVGPVRGAACLPVGTSELFAAHDRGQDHVVGTGHFSKNGADTDQVILDTTI